MWLLARAEPESFFTPLYPIVRGRMRLLSVDTFVDNVREGWIEECTQSRLACNE